MKKTPNVKALKQWARSYWNIGLNIVPEVITKEGDEWKKVPTVKWGDWLQRRQTKEEFESLPWESCNGFAVILGKIEIGRYMCCFDLDTKNIKTEEARQLGRKVLEKLPKTRRESTVNDGIHVFCLCREEPKTESKYHDLCGVELLGVGKLCVMHPSFGYEVASNSPAAEIENANELLEEIFEKCETEIESVKTWFGRHGSKGKRHRGPHPPCIEELLKGVSEGERNETCIRVSSYLRNFRGLIRKTTLARLREWNERNQPPLPEKEIMNTLKSAEQHRYVYGCNDPVLSAHCKDKDSCPLFPEKRKQEDLTPLELIDRELTNAKAIQLHPLIDFHPELGYNMGLVIDKDKTLQIIDKKVYTFDIGVLISELPSPNPVLVKERKFSDISRRYKEGILKIAKDITEGKEIEKKSKKGLFNLVLEKVLWYWYHSDLRWHLFMVCFIIAVYYHRLFPVFPNLSLQGVRKSGKTTMGLLFGELSCNPTKLQAGLRSAPLFRTVEDSRPTYLADLTKVDYRDKDLIDLFEVIEPHGSVRRCVGDENKPRDFRVFCPKVLMVRQTVPFSDKCIECLTEPAPKGSLYTERRIFITSDPVLKEASELLLRSVICNWRLVLDAYNSIKQDKKLFGRRFELWRPLLAVCRYYAPERYDELLTLAYEDAEETERGDVTSEVENTLLGYFLTIDEKKQSIFVPLKRLTEETQEILGSQVVKSYHIVKSALKNLKVIKKRMDTTGGVKYQIDLAKVRKIAEERDIICSQPVCPICGLVILDNQETETDKDGEPVHKSCYFTHPLKPPRFCHLCGEDILDGQDLANWNGSRIVHRSCYDRELERIMDSKQKRGPEEITEITEESRSRLPTFEEMQAEMGQMPEDED